MLPFKHMDLDLGAGLQRSQFPEPFRSGSLILSSTRCQTMDNHIVHALASAFLESHSPFSIRLFKLGLTQQVLVLVYFGFTFSNVYPVAVTESARKSLIFA